MPRLLHHISVRYQLGSPFGTIFGAFAPMRD